LAQLLLGIYFRFANIAGTLGISNLIVTDLRQKHRQSVASHLYASLRFSGDAMTMRLKMLLCASSAMILMTAAAQAAEAPAAPVDVEGVTITAPRQEDAARAKQQAAPVIVSIQSAETIAKYPDYNAAEALGRIPGISLSTDTGEGRFVNIRGIDANLNGATYGGVVLLNTFAAGTAASGSGRAVEFDTIPTGAIDGIIVYKTLSPDREAEGLGGQIELTPRSAKNLARPFFEGELGWGYENLHDHTGPFTAGFAAGARFGFNNGKIQVEGMGPAAPDGSGWISNPTPFSLVITASRKDDRRGVDDIEPSYNSDGSYDRVDFRRYDYSRRRFGYGGEFAFQPNDDHSYYARLDVAGYKERAHKNHFYAQFDGSPSAPDKSGNVVDGFQPQVDLVLLEETHRNTVFAVGGQDRFDQFQIDYRAAYSRATYVENYYDEARYRGQDIYFGRYNKTNDPYHPTFSLFQDGALTKPFVSTDATLYSNPRLTAFFEPDVDEEYSYVINASHPLQLFGEGGVVKVGASARLRDKVVVDFGGRSAATGSLSDISASVGAGNGYYDGRGYPLAPYADIYKMIALVRSKLPTLAPSISRDFSDTENVYAAYAMYTASIGKLGVMAGVRVEATDATYGNFLTTTDSGGNDHVSFVNHNKSYTNVFPTLQLKYEIQPDLQVRATYSTGIARPGFSQAGGNASVDFTASPRPALTAGNPNLKPTTGNNFDLDIEYYMPNGGIIQAGVFDKEFENYIFRAATLNVADPIFQGQKGDFFTFFNETAYARGVELAYHQKFTMLPGLLSGLGVDGNITWVDSRFKEYDATISATGKNQYGSLPGTSHVTWNLAGFYEDHGLAMRLSTQYVGQSLFGLSGGDKSGDTIQDRKLNMDFTSSYRFTSNWTGYLNVKNLLDTPLRYYQGTRSQPIQREIYGQTYEVGVRATF
jgi:TonB-dependent receptor